MNERSLALVTREIMWQIPPLFKTIMYILFFISLIFFVTGLVQKLFFITNGASLRLLFNKRGLFVGKLNFKDFFKTICFAGKVPSQRLVFIFHSLIFYGFLILWIATDLVAIHYDTPLKIFTGSTYIIISFLADFAGLAMLIGLALAYYRRYIKKPLSLRSTEPYRELSMYIMLIALVLLGFLLEGVRIVGNDFPIGEKSWSPIGWNLALVLQRFKWTEETFSLLYKTTWFIHMLNTMIFIAIIPFSKFLHMFLIPFNALVTPSRRGAILNPMNFEDETKETFGLAKLSELTFKNRLDLLSCVECGRCTDVCPANSDNGSLDPKLIITKIRDLAYKHQDKNIWEGPEPLYSEDELDACTTCGACMEECPAHIEHVQLIMEAKRYKTLTLGKIPPSAADALQKIRNNGNPWGIAQEDRFKWADGENIPVIKKGKKVDFLYYIGCAGSYDTANQKVVKDTLSLFKKASVSFAVLGKIEKCNGDPIRRFGDEYSFFEVAVENITQLNTYDFNKIVTHCPHCLHTIGKEYGKFEKGQFETIHHTELLAELLKTGRLKPEKKIDEELTFHDPCYLGRHHNVYDAPRDILKATGAVIKEMKSNKEKALCCGMGGGHMWYEEEGEVDLAENRLEQISTQSQKKLATACSYCMINFNSSKSKKTNTENLEIEDVASILSRTINL